MRAYLLLLVSAFLINTIEAQPVIPGLVANWKMNGNFSDASGNAINGTANGATATTNKAGQASSAMNFSNPSSTSVAQFATIPNNALLRFSGTQNFTVSMLVNISSFIHNMGLYDNNLNYNGYGIWAWNPSGTVELRFNYKNGSLGVSPLPVGTWVHIAAVRNNGTLSLYINGVLKGSAAEGTLVPAYNFSSFFGTMFFNAQAPPQYNGLQGKLDEAGIYNRALSAAEITSLASFLLPLKLGDFSAVKKSSGIALFWNTISETNTKNFVVERSNDGTTFNAIGEVAAAGNSSQSRNYEFTDATPATGTVYYRLRMNDQDGTATLSRVVAVTNNRFAGQLKVFPNPAVDQVQFQWQGQEGKQVQVEILDLAGRIRFSRNYQLQDGVQTFSLPLAGFNSGIYTLRVKDAAGQQSTLFSKN